MAAETDRPVAAETDAPAAAVTPKPSPWANPQVRVAAIIIAVIVAGVAVYFLAFHNSKHHHKKKPQGNFKTIGPMFESKAGLKAEAITLGTTFYWAGPKPGFQTEFTRNNYGNFFVRYLPTKTHVGAPGAHWTVVVTYPDPGGYAALQAQAKAAGNHTVAGPGGSIIYVDRADPKSVYVAFKSNPDFQVVVFSPNATIAAQIASSGKVRAITG